MRVKLFAMVATLAAGLSASALAAEKTLTIYTYESFVAEWGPGAKVAAAFEKSCACKVEWVGVADGVELLTRLKLEGESTKADIVLGLDTSLITEAKATGLFEPHGLSPQGLTVPGGFSDDTFLPYDYGHFAIIYDTDALKDPPHSLKELVEGNPDEKIVIQDPRTSTPGLGLLLWMKSVYGDKAAEAWTKLKPRVLTVTPGWSESYGLFTKGEAPMVLSYTTSPAYHMIAENTDRYQAASFTEGHYVQIEVAGMTKTSDDKDLARQFLSFMTGPDFQSIIPETNWMMPVGATKDPLPDAFGKLVKPEKTLLLGSDEVAAHRKAWIDEWLSAMSAN
ncbi:thiamine ABC transporter substrate binding subunit [Sinorhizobium sp. BG8]|uniref:thiamine ABC transporter substrate binding subunit n=1 Tax=Sinorhizobium sp. BG8 TaxID=2613773 RepID=UPI00193E8646|nr:thiamine ABC transporter substrate binding subunit [Sinorhizobium sp. BG8]QRM53503.1 thiamine ABC transporter substrate binding subunit [Sinorhizobium sp. BG8]